MRTTKLLASALFIFGLLIPGLMMAAEGDIDCDVDGDGINDSFDPACWGGNPPPPSCSSGNTVACLDNCPAVPNAGQEDADSDGVGDACDCDVDGDGINDSFDPACWGGNPPPPSCSSGNTVACLDNCPAVPNAGQEDADSDGVGDACDCDVDGDGINDSFDPACWGGNPPPPSCSSGNTVACLDNCPAVPNAGQEDADSDGVGDACDCDVDGDGINDSFDPACWGGNPPPPSCSSGNTVACLDNCPAVPNAGQEDADSDGVGDACDCDVDGDGINDSFDPACWGGNPPPPSCSSGNTVACLDNCPAVPNAGQEDADSDGVGDACDCDVDGDGINDSFDPACWGGNPPPPSCSSGNTVACLDNCPAVPNAGQEDADSDGVGDACDLAPLIFQDGFEEQSLESGSIGKKILEKKILERKYWTPTN